MFNQILWIAVFLLAIQVPSLLEAAVKKTSDHDTVMALVGTFFVVYLFILWAEARLFLRNRWIKPQPQTIGQQVKWIGGATVVQLVGQCVLLFCNYLIYHQTETTNNSNIIKLMSSNKVAFGMTLCSTLIFAPLVEELLFRGLIMNVFDEGSFWLPICVSGIVFTLMHASSTPISYFIYFFLGAVMAYVYRVTGRISNSIWIHFINNVLGMLLLIMRA